MNNDIIAWLTENQPQHVAFLIRHAHRYPIPKGVIEHQNVPLTMKGRRLAREFGTNLPLSYSIRLFHSPIPRCKETAEYVRKGFQQTGGSANVLGDQDFLRIDLVDQREMVRILDRIGHQQFGYRWLKGQFDERVIEKPENVASKTVHGVIALMETDVEKQMDIHITHDLNILAVRDLIAPVPNEHFDWPAYLNGIIFTHNAENVTLIQRHVSKTIKHNK